jgi:SAM-dependent methyltransferase
MMLGRLKNFYAAHARHSSDDVLLTLCGDVTLPYEASLLDVGCGSGEATARFGAALGARQLFGLDGSVPTARAAATRGVRVAIADFEHPFPFAAARFHVIALNQVIEHVRNLDLFVSEIARVLHAGGHVLLATPNLASWTNIGALVLQQQAFSQTISSRYYLGNRFSRAYRQPIPHDFPQHCHLLTSRGLRDLLGMYGLHVIRLRGAGYFPFPGRSLARLDSGHAQYLVAHAVKR